MSFTPILFDFENVKNKSRKQSLLSLKNVAQTLDEIGQLLFEIFSMMYISNMKTFVNYDFGVTAKLKSI